MTVGQGYVIYIDGPISIKEEVTTQRICGLMFIYPTSQVMEYYLDGKFSSLSEAYESGILSENQLRYLYEIHRGNFDYPYAE